MKETEKVKNIYEEPEVSFVLFEDVVLLDDSKIEGEFVPAEEQNSIKSIRRF